MKYLFCFILALFESAQAQTYPVPINQLPSASTLTGSEYSPIWQNGGTYKTTLGQLSSFVSSSFVTPTLYGAKGDCVTDDTLALQNIFRLGGYISKPPGACWKVTRSLLVYSGVTVSGAGQPALIKLVLPAGFPAVPVLDLSGSGQTTTSNITLANFAVDGGNAVGLAAPTVYFGNKAAGAGILVQSNNTVLTNLWVNNSWDNGIGIGQPTTSVNTNTSQPTFVTVTDVNCQHNGYGSGGGACIDNLAGSPVTVKDSMDFQSEYNFIIDQGSGAVSMFANLTGKAANKNCYYVGSPNSLLVNIYAQFCALAGIWIDTTSAGNGNVGVSTLTNFTAINVQQQGVLAEAGNWILGNIFVKNASLQGSLLYDDISFQNPGGQTQNITNVQVLGACSDGVNHRYGYSEVPGGTFTINVALNDYACLSGATAAVQPGTAKAVQPLGQGNYIASGGNILIGTSTDLGAASAQVNVNNGSVFLGSGGGNIGTLCSNIYFSGSFKYAANGFGGCIKYNNTGGGDFALILYPSNSGGAGASATGVRNFSALNTGGFITGGTVAIASLPTCNAAYAGARMTVNNGVASPTYQGAVSTTGTTTQPVYCNGSGWVYD